MKTLSPKFVKYIPNTLEDGVLYISKEYGTAIHKCPCGCGNQVVTPLASNGWELKSNGSTVSLYPSIGNWNFECKSHYWIINNEVRWDSDLRHEETPVRIYGGWKGKIKFLREWLFSLLKLF